MKHSLIGPTNERTAAAPNRGSTSAWCVQSHGDPENSWRRIPRAIDALRRDRRSTNMPIRTQIDGARGSSCSVHPCFSLSPQTPSLPKLVVAVSGRSRRFQAARSGSSDMRHKRRSRHTDHPSRPSSPATMKRLPAPQGIVATHDRIRRSVNKHTCQSPIKAASRCRVHRVLIPTILIPVARTGHKENLPIEKQTQRRKFDRFRRRCRANRMPR